MGHWFTVQNLIWREAQEFSNSEFIFQRRMYWLDYVALLKNCTNKNQFFRGTTLFIFIFNNNYLETQLNL